MTRHQTSDATRWTLAAIVLCTTALACPGPAAAATQRLAHDNAAAAATHSVADNKAAAYRAAERTMNGVALPPGAVRVGADPEVVTRLTWLHNAVSDTPSAPNVVDLHRFFRVSERPAAVFHWLTRHRPRGSTPLARGRAVVHGRTADWSVSFAFRGVRNTITQSGVGFELTSARGGGTALRVEGWAAWFVPRPAFERVPDSAHAVVVSLDGPGPKLFPVSTVTDPQSVAELIQFVNSRQLVQPDSATACSPSLFPRIDLRFVPAVGAAPVAHAVADGCVALNFSVGARRGPPLSTGPVDLGDLLWKLHAVPVCTPGQLSGSATPRAGKSEGGGARLTELRLTNVSQTVCGLEGFPRLRFRGADGKPLPTRATNFGASVYAVILAPGALAAIELVWGTLPQCPLAASIDVTPPALATALTIAVGSPSHPMRPCDGAVFVSPVGVSLAKLLGITSRFRAERR